MKKILVMGLMAAMFATCAPALAGTHGHNGDITPKSVGAGCLSLLLWPGVGQLMNNESDSKTLTHAVLGFTGVFRIWSGYDALVNRKGGVWDNRI
jgi:hypothetical protein